MPAGSVRLAGWVLKEGKINGWKRRWCAIHDDSVVWWAKQGDSGKPKDSIALDSLSEVSQHDGVVAIRTPSRNIQMNPVGSPSLTEWIDALQHAAAEASQRRAERVTPHFDWEHISGNLRPPNNGAGGSAGTATPATSKTM